MVNISLQDFKRLRNTYSTTYSGINPIDSQFSQLVSNRLKPSEIGFKANFLQRVKAGLISRYNQYYGWKKVRKFIQRADYLFFLAEPTHLNQNLPVIRELRDKGYKVVLVLSKLKLLKLLDLETKRYPVFVLPAVDLPRRKAELLPDIKSNLKELLENESLHDDLESSISKEIPLLLALDNFWRSSLADSRLKAVIIGNDLPRDGRTLTIVSAEIGIPTYSIQHGNIPDDLMHSEHKVDHMLLYGEQSANRLSGMGISKERIEICGPPYLDEELKKDRTEHVKRIREFLGLEATPASSTTLIALSGAGHRTSKNHHRIMINSLMELARLNPEILFITKLHRKDKPGIYKEVAGGKLPLNFRLVEHIPDKVSSNIFDWLELADTIITSNSAVGGEAILQGKALISIDLLNEYKGVDYRDFEACIFANTEQDLFENFEKLMKNGLPDSVQANIEKFIRAFYGPGRDGQSAKRCAEYIINTTVTN